MHTTVTWKNVSRPKNREEDPSNCQKKSEKKFADVLKDPKTSLEQIRVAHNAFSCSETISRGTVRRILKKYGVFSRNNEKKSHFEEEKQRFSFKMVYQYAQEAVLFLTECGFHWWNKGAHLQRRNR